MNLQKAFIPTDGVSRETREGWPLLTVETEVNGTQRGQMNGVLSCLVCCVCRSDTRDFCPALAALKLAQDKIIFFITVQYFNSFFPIAQQAGQAVVLDHQSLSMCRGGLA